jgi:hypothetical protein
MINFIKNLFNRNQELPENTIPNNSLLFSINPSGEPFIKIRIEDAEDFSAINFGKLLCLINDGKMQQSMLDVLLDISKQNNISHKFIQKVLLTWRDENTKEYSKLDLNPIIKPTDFNTIAKK